MTHRVDFMAKIKKINRNIEAEKSREDKENIRNTNSLDNATVLSIIDLLEVSIYFELNGRYRLLIKFDACGI